METSLDVQLSFSQISYSSTSPELSIKKNYPHFYRTIPDDASFNAPRIALLKAFKWSHVGTIFQEEDIHRTVQMNFFCLKHINRFRLKTHTSVFMHFRLSSTLKRPKTPMKTDTFENAFKIGDFCKSIVLKALRF